MSPDRLVSSSKVRKGSQAKDSSGIYWSEGDSHIHLPFVQEFLSGRDDAAGAKFQSQLSRCSSLWL